MFDFTRYNYLEGRGWAEFNKPAYEKRLWDDDGSWFEAPTIRGIVDIGMSIVGAIVVPGFGAALFGLVDDLVFTVADVSGGYKSATDAFGAFAKKAAVAVATSLVGDLGIGDAVTGALGGSGIETGLLNIIAGTSGKIYDSFTDEEKTIAQTLMTSAGMSMNATGYWTECGRDQKLDMYSYMNAAGTHVPDVLFNTYYNNTVDSLLAQTWGVDLGFENNNAIPETLAEKYSALISQHLQQTSTPTSLKDKYKFTVFGKDEVGTDLFKIDENNPFLDQLLGQHDFAGINNVIDNSGCNFMAIFGIVNISTVPKHPKFI